MHDDEDVEVYEMTGTLVEWDGESGYMHSDDGARIFLSKRHLNRQAFAVPLKVGDRIHSWVTAEISCSPHRIRVIEPREPDDNEMRRLNELTKKIAERKNGRLVAAVQFRDTFAGTIESYNARKKAGVIRWEDGECICFKRDCLGALRLKKIKPGMPVRFEACNLWGTWSVVRILSLGEP